MYHVYIIYSVIVVLNCEHYQQLSTLHCQPCCTDLIGHVIFLVFWVFSFGLNFWSSWHFLSIVLVHFLPFCILTFFTFWPLDAHSCSASGRERMQAKCHLQIFITDQILNKIQIYKYKAARIQLKSSAMSSALVGTHQYFITTVILL